MAQQDKKMTPNEAFQEMRILKLSQTIFPKELFPEGFKEAFQKALMFNSIIQLKCHDFTWRSYAMWDHDFVMPEVDLMCSVLRAASPNEMGQTLEESWKMIESLVHPTMAEWDRLDSELSEPIRREIQAKIASERVIPEHKKSIVLPNNKVIQKHILPG